MNLIKNCLKLSLIILIVLFQFAFTATQRILIDGKFDDWESKSSLWFSSATSSVGNITLQNLKAFNDDDYLFVYFESTETFSLLENNNLKLYIDTDNDNLTGHSIDGMGAEIEMNFGTRKGLMHSGTATEIGFSDLFMVTAPTVWNNEYEFSICRNTKNSSEETIFTNNTIKILLKNESASKTDVVTYSFSSNDLEPLPTYSIKKKSDDFLRVVSHNVEYDGFFKNENLDTYERLYSTMDPNIIGFVEIYNHSDEDLNQRLEEILPSNDGEKWNASHIADNFLATRYSILGSYSCGDYGNGAFYINMRPYYNCNALVIVAHPPCCSSNDEARSNEIDAIAAFIRDAKSGGGELTIAENTPIILLGDMNLVGNPKQWETLLTGDIDSEDSFGSDFYPDWDGSDFMDAIPYDSNLPMAFTQGVSTFAGGYPKGRLDVTLYSGSVLDLKNSFVLYTNALPNDSLNYYGLLLDDTESASDHFPLVSDFKILAEQGLKISDLRQNDETGTPIHLNEVVTVSGIVTVADDFGSNGPAYIQLDNAGVSIYGYDLVSQISTKDVITITSPVGFYNGLTQLTYDSENSSISIISTDLDVEPTKVTISEILNQEWNGNEALEGMLLQLENMTFSEEGNFSAYSIYSVSDGENTFMVRIDESVNLVGKAIPSGSVNVVGVLSQYDSESPYNIGYYILPRSIDDISEYNDNSISIKNIQYTENPGDDGTFPSLIVGDSVNICGTVTGLDPYGFYLQDEESDWSGIYVYLGSDVVLGFTIDDSVSVNGIVKEYNGLTELVANISDVEVLKTDAGKVKPVDVCTGDFSKDLIIGESCECVLVRFTNVTVTQAPDDYGQWYVDDGTGEFEVDDWFYAYIPEVGDFIDTLVGIIRYHFGSFELDPRSEEDIFIDSSRAITIADLRQNDEAGIPIHLNEVVTVSGIVTVADEFGSNGPAYIQSDNAGISIYGSDLVSQISTNDVITITSPVGFYNGLTQLTYDSDTSAITIHTWKGAPDPTVVTIPDISNQEWNGNEALEGVLLKLENMTFSEKGNFSAYSIYSVSDGENTFMVRIDESVNLVGKTIPSGSVNIVGVLSQYDSESPYNIGYYLLPRSTDDISGENIYISSSVPDLIIFEDSQSYVLADLDTVFCEAPEGQSIEFSVTSDTSAVSTSINNENLVTINIASQWNGDAMIILSAELEETFVNDTVLLTVAPVNDPPFFTDIIPDSVFMNATDIDTLLIDGWVEDIDTPDSLFNWNIVQYQKMQLQFIEDPFGLEYRVSENLSGMDSVIVSVNDGYSTINNTIIFVYEGETAIDEYTVSSNEFSLDQNFPNPFNPTTSIRYSIPRKCNVLLTVVDISGREIAKLVDREQSSGKYKVKFNGEGLPSGIYFYQLKSDVFVDCKKFMLLK